MILLSSLLGPAKPPVATQSDVSSAGGLYRLVEYAGSLVAESLDSAGTIQVAEAERCLICLSDYEAAEELRQLNTCKHLYHKECIDQVCFCYYHMFPRVASNQLLLPIVVDYRPEFLPALQGTGCF